MFLFFVNIGLLHYCSVSNNPVSDGGAFPQTPPLPRTGSIIPLAKGSYWHYSYTDYDDSGSTIHSAQELNLEIPAVYGRIDTRLELLQTPVDTNAYDEFVYAYEWESSGQGYLLSYRDLNEHTPGVYIVGEYAKNNHHLYDTAVLWLSYPAKPGSSWSAAIIDSSSAIESKMELVAIDTTFYVPIAGELGSAVSFHKCYLYRQSDSNSVSYYYFNKDIGALGYLHYKNDKLKRSYILRSYYTPRT